MPIEDKLIRITPKTQTPPLWGNFIWHADRDLMAVGILCSSGLWVQGLYCATQATEKYFKALMLSIIDPNGRTLKPDSGAKRKWLNVHDLLELASYCDPRYPYYREQSVRNVLEKFNEYDQSTRYPWVPGSSGEMSTSDFSELEPVLWNLRRDIPINCDDYPLGIIVRGCSHRDISAGSPSERYDPEIVRKLRTIFSRLDELVRWPEINKT